MIVIYKQLFDFSAYYAIAGLYFLLIGNTAPGVPGFILLGISAAAAEVQRKFLPDKKVYLYLCLCIPAFYLLFGPTLWQMVHLIPVWAYLVWIELTGRIYTSADEFPYHFSRNLWLLLLMLPPVLFAPEKWSQCVTASLPYIILMLSLGVCLLRILRANSSGYLKQSIIMAVFLAACLVFCLLGLPAIMADCVGFLWQYFFKYIIELLALVIAGVVFVVAALGDLLLRTVTFKGLDNSLLLNLKPLLGEETLQEIEDAAVSDPRALKISLIILGCIAAAFGVFLLLRAMAGSRSRADTAASDHALSPQYVPSAKNYRAGLIRPSDPRMAVRFYLQKTLREGIRRGADITEDMTPGEMFRRCSAVYPPDDLKELMELYSPARYNEMHPVSKKDANRAEALWRRLKKSEMQ